MDELQDMAHRNEENDLLKPLWEVGDFFEPVGHMGNTNAYYFGGVALGWVTGQDRLSLICAQILEAHFIAGLGKNAVQAVVRRPRPFQGYESDKFGVEDATSFPSGHSINIFQLATILSHHVNRRPFTWAAYACAGLVGIQRVRADMHWSSDVLLSAVYGTAVSARRAEAARGTRDGCGPPRVAAGCGACRWPGGSEWPQLSFSQDSASSRRRKTRVVAISSASPAIS